VPTANPSTDPRPFLIDSHSHIGDADFDADREAVVARAREAGVETILVVGVMDGRGSHTRALDSAQQFGLPCAVGVHPHEARLGSEADFQELADLAVGRRIVAVGEIGLDFHYDHSPRDVQSQVFARQIRLARELRLPIIVHTREADPETLAILQAEHAGEVGGVIHCFIGGPELAQRTLELGFHISFSGILTFPRAEGLRAIAREVPLDRLLIETDAPYLAPPPHRGRRNEPAFVRRVAETLAQCRGCSVAELAQATADNFRRCFGL